MAGGAAGSQGTHRSTHPAGHPGRFGGALQVNGMLRVAVWVDLTSCCKHGVRTAINEVQNRLGRMLQEQRIRWEPRSHI